MKRGRHSTVALMSHDEQATVQRRIRDARYMLLDGVLSQLKADGLTISRSALYRYASALRLADQGIAPGEGSTVVIVLDLNTAAIFTMRTTSDPESVVSAIRRSPGSIPSP